MTQEFILRYLVAELRTLRTKERSELLATSRVEVGLACNILACILIPGIIQYLIFNPLLLPEVVWRLFTYLFNSIIIILDSNWDSLQMEL